MTIDVETDYLNKVTSEHRQKPKYIAMLTAVLQPLCEVQDFENDLSMQYDLDVAVGKQLDVVGQWIGLSRDVTSLIPDVYFSFDTPGLGFDQGVWFGPGSPTTGLIQLPDDSYRLLLKARAVNNAWNGSIPQAYEIWDQLFDGTGISVFIIDNGDLTMDLGIATAEPLSALNQALFQGGYLDLRPAGVLINQYIIVTGLGLIFALDAPPPPAYAGLDVGYWASILPPI